MKKEKSANELFRPLILLSVAATILLFIGGYDLALRMNQSAKEREQQLVSNGIANKIIEVEKGSVGQVIWDDALSNLEARNIEWA